MPDKCCVPGCRSNYRKEEGYVTVFRFPQADTVRQKWIKNIPRKDWVPTDRSVVCAKHFRQDEITTFDKYTDTAGAVHIFNRRCPVLKLDAVPTIFPNLPTYLSTEPTVLRKDPKTRAAEINDRYEASVDKWLASDMFIDFCRFQAKFEVELKDSLKFWKHISMDNEYVLLYKVKVEANCAPCLGISIKILPDLSFFVYDKGDEVSFKILTWITNNRKLERWSQIQNLMAHYQHVDSADVTALDFVLKAHENLVKAITLSSNEQHNKALQFLDEQLHLMSHPDNRKRYSSSILCFAFMAYIKSPSCYRFLRNSELLCLPHPSTLKSLVASKTSETCIIKYLTVKSKQLSSREQFVAIQMDEIHVKTALNYTGGKLVGSASNSNETATTVQAFLISSIFGSYTDVVGLIPMIKMSATDLKQGLLQAISNVQSAGFTVLVVLSDNNAVNRKVYKELLAGSSDKYHFDNPQIPGTPIFLLHDSVHLLKCIWHNWVNQKDTDQCFNFPTFPSDDASTTYVTTISAKFSHIKSLYRSEQKQTMKLAPSLTNKALFPSTFDRQNVALALAIFSDYNTAALKLYRDDRMNKTADFITIILQWWTIVNVKHKFCGVRSRNVFGNPITSTDRSNLIFIKRFVLWLETWQKLTGKAGKLTDETFYALKHTMNAVAEFATYALDTLKVEYILLGKLQTDNLEARFGEYRQLSGCNYLISVQQILEAERKLKIYSILRMSSQSCGEVPISDLSVVCNVDTEHSTSNSHIIDASFTQEWFIINIHDCNIFSSEGADHVLVYISGYVAHKMCKRLKCTSCAIFFHQLNDMHAEIELDVACCDYTKFLDRGGLKYPTKSLTTLTFISYAVMQKLLSSDFEPKFLASTNHRDIVVKLVTASYLQYCKSEKMEKCKCGKSKISTLLMSVPTLANIFLNNYRKVRNDDINSRKTSTSRKRKLAKFSH